MVKNSWNDGFIPVIDEKSIILILGSFPSVKSREIGFYYGNPQNRFWKTIEKATGEVVPSAIEDNKQYLANHKIALWDVYESSAIVGSSDAALNENTGKTGDLNGLLASFPNIKAVLCNGKKSFSVASSAINTGIPCLCLTSTSSANPRFNEEQWINTLRKFLFNEE